MTKKALYDKTLERVVGFYSPRFLVNGKNPAPELMENFIELDVFEDPRPDPDENTQEISENVEIDLNAKTFRKTYAMAQYETFALTIEEARAAMEITKFQAKAVLLQARLLDTVETLIATDPTVSSLTKLAWSEATSFKRLSASVLELGPKLGLSDTDLDNMFMAGELIEA